MILDDVTSFWWESLTGPQLLIERIAACLSDGKNVIIQTDGRLPWQEQMRDFVSHRLTGAGLQVLEDFDPENRNDLVPALLKRLQPSGLSRCPAAYQARLTYLRDEGLLAGAVVWLVPRRKSDACLLPRFLSDYRGKGLTRHGVFAVELPKSQPLPPHLSEQVAVVDCADYIRRGDLTLFASILAEGEPRIPSGLKGYLANVSAALVGQNAELIPDLLQEMDAGREDPIDALGRVLNQWALPCPQGSADRETLESLVWRAQLESVFALIEMERLRITERYRDLIEEALATEFWDARRDQPDLIRQRGDELEDASDAELGTLVRMMALRRWNNRTELLLVFPDEGLRDWIIFLRDCRNSLAHHHACTPKQMCRLLEGGPEDGEA